MTCPVKHDDEEDGPEPGEECGRWSNGSLERYCAKGGTEECDFECPYRKSHGQTLTTRITHGISDDGPAR